MRMNEENKIILYQDDNEITRVSVRFADEDLWLTQSQLSEIYQTSKSNVSEHIKHIFFKFRKYSNNVIKKAKEFDNSMIITILMSPDKRYSTL